MNKKTTIMLCATAGAIALTATILANSGRGRLWLSADPEPGGSLTLDATLPDCPFQESKFQAESAKGNSFWFNNDSMTMADGVFTIQDGGYLENETVLNGIYRMEITVTAASTLHFTYRIPGYYASSQDIGVNAGLNVIEFPSFDPSIVRIYGEKDSLSFSKLVFYYSCIADEPEYTVESAMTQTIEGWSVYEDHFMASVGTELSALDLGDYRFRTNVSGSVSAEYISGFQISYASSSSTTVLPGENSVNVSFVYNESTYTGTIDLIGYDHIATDIRSLSLSDYSIRKKASDALPEGLRVTAYGYLYLKDSIDKDLAELSANRSVDLTAGMVESYDENPFTKIGRHSMVVNAFGQSRGIQYEIYDPEVNNISDLYCSSSLTVDAGTTSEQFYDYIATKTFTINYYEDDKSLPHETTLSSENFVLSGDEFDGSSLNVNVRVNYQTYSGFLYVSVKKQKGDLIATYHNDEGLMFMGGPTYRIALYENDIAVAYSTKEGESGGYEATYSLDGTTLTLIASGTPFLFTINEEAKTFSEYVSSATLLYTLAVDFQAFGAPAVAYEGKLYDDNTIAFDIEGMKVNCNFTYDPSDNTIIYFTFMSSATKGTIDYTLLTMVAEPVA